MAEALTWTQFVSVMGMLTAVAGITLGVAAYFFKQWLEAVFAEIKGDLADIKAEVRRLAEGQAEMDKRLSERMARLEGAFEGHLERGGA